MMTPADLNAVTRWLAAHTTLSPPLRARRFEGGRSNLTFHLTDADGRSFVLRHPPRTTGLQSAHDMSREWRMLHALAPTSVPVPPLVGTCEDDDVIGVPFYVMDFVDGTVISSAEDAEAALPVEDRRSVARDLVATLARLHDLDPAVVGLSDLARGADYVQRQIRRWRTQHQVGHHRTLPQVEHLAARLGAAAPPQRRTGIVHGDYRLGNCLVHRGGVAAVLDWELATIGDPMADLGAFVVYWSTGSPAWSSTLAEPTTVIGFPTQAEVIDWYAADSGAAMDDAGWFVAFAAWRLAVILDGVDARRRAGAYGSARTPEFDDEVDFLLGWAEHALSSSTPFAPPRPRPRSQPAATGQE